MKADRSARPFARRILPVMLAACLCSRAIADEVIVDNADSAFTVLSGSWSTATDTNQWGSDYRYIDSRTSPPGEVEWRPDLPSGGQYDVSVWYPSANRPPANAQYTVHYDGGTFTVAVDQQQNGGQWNSLGTFAFAAGTTGRVTLTSQAQWNRNVNADAVRFRTLAPVNLTVAVEPADGGVTVPAAGGPYPRDPYEVVAIQAVAGPDLEFKYWTVSAGAQAANPSAATTTVVMDLDKTVTAVFGPADPQFRGFWADAFHDGMQTSSQIDAMINAAATGNYNAILPEVMAFQDNEVGSHGAYWQSNAIARSTYVTAQLDPLAYMVQQAHANGIELHPWLVAFRVASTWPPAGHPGMPPEWLMVPRAAIGTIAPVDGYYVLDPGSPDVQEYLVSIVREIVTNYDVDGVHWDYIRYVTTDAGYPADLSYANSSLARFQAITGRTDVPATSDAQWNDFRRRTITELIRRVRAEIAAANPDPQHPLRHSAALITWGDAPVSFTSTSAYGLFQDWEVWLERGYLDAGIPMCYYRETQYPTWYRHWVDAAIGWRHNRQMFIGPGVYLNTPADSVSQIQYALNAGADGIVTYSYAVTRSDSSDYAAWYPYVAAQVSAQPAPTPEMPWYDPATATEGTAWGRVYDLTTDEPIDNSTVTVAGVGSAQTDGNGLYVMTMIPATQAGLPYDVTASYAGYNDRTLTAVVTAGGLARLDIALGGCAADAECSDGVFCNGAETCDAQGQCQPGTPPACDDGVDCTIDSCNAGSDSCEHVPDDGSCDNGVFCDGAETCDALLGCQAGSNPCAGDEWCDATGTTCIVYGSGDCDGDADRDLADFASFQLCFAQSGEPTCRCGNLTGADGTIDLDDYEAFAQQMSGPQP